MHLLAKETVSIRAASDSVFSYVSNMENFPTWFPAVIGIESQDDAPHGTVGKSYLESVKLPFRGLKTIKLNVVESVPATRFATEGLFPPLMPRMEIDIQADDISASTLTWRMYSRTRSSLFKVLLLPLVKVVISKRAKAGTSRLKRILEQANTTVHSSERPESS